MGGVKVEANLSPPGGWARDAHDLVVLIQEHPIYSAILFLGLLVVLAMLPGGAVPSWIKYRGARRLLDSDRNKDVPQLVERLGKRARRRERGKQKGGAE